MNLPAGHGACHSVPNARLDPGRFIRDDQHVLAVIALKVLRLISREADREIVVIAEFEFGRLQFGIGDFRAFDEPVDFRPELRPHLTSLS